MNLPKITIITPSYNQGDFLEDTFRSVLDQKYPNLEYFVVDGGSKDNSVDIIKRYARHFDWWVSEKDRGQSHAINKGLERATGDIVTWLNSDDFFYPGALDYVAQAWQAHPQAGLFVGNGTLADRQGRRVRRYSKTLAWDYDTLLRGANYILQPATFLARRVFQEQGFIDEKITYGMDLELWLRVGNKYPVVTIDEELAAFRWYEEVKSVAGGFKEWIAMYEMTRRYCPDPITPGLVLEFFKKLQDPKTQAAAGFEGFAQFAQAHYWKFYNQLQTLLGTADCIPLVNKGIAFVPKKSGEPRPPVAEKPAPAKPRAVVSALASVSSPAAAAPPAARRTVVDIVLPAGHSWFVREGYVEALKAAGVLGRVFYIPSWAPDDQRSQELFDYLKQPQADAIFLMDTLWHAQTVHATEAWRQRWAQCPAKKILFSFECMTNPWLRNNPKWWADNSGAVARAAQCVDAVVYAHEPDGDLFRQHGLAALWQPFAVDPAIFPPLKDFAHRKPRGFFKGKAERFYNDDNCYRQRRELIAHLRQHAPGVDVVDQYSFAGGGVLERNQEFIREMGEYQLVVGLPSLSPTMVVRPFEAMLSGCLFLQNRIDGERSNQLFRDGEHLVLYDAAKPAELVKKINELLADPARARRIAENGRREVLARHTILHRVAEVLPWLEKVAVRHASAPVLSIPAVATPVAATPVVPLAAAIAAAKPSGGGKIVIDGVVFDMQRGRPHGISRVWHRLLEQLAQTPLAGDIVLLDRDGTAPAIPGIRRRAVAGYDYQRFEADSLWLQRWCTEEKAALFISTYFTYAENTPTIIMLHDMIPEITGQDLSQPEWRAKNRAIDNAAAYFAVSRSTIVDFHRLYPQHAERKIFLTYNAVGDEVAPASAEAVHAFRGKHNVLKPYFLLVGNRTLYKNAMLFFRGLALLPEREHFEVICVGGQAELESAFKPFLRDVSCRVLRVNDDELRAAYTGAAALAYTSCYEGFGLPVLEAQKCGCPVIACRNSSLPEVAGDTVIYVGESDVAAMKQALQAVQQPETRAQLVAAGQANHQRFSWARTAQIIAAAATELMQAAASGPRPATGPIDTFRRFIFILDQQGEAARKLAGQLRIIHWHYAGFNSYEAERLGTAEAAAAGELLDWLPSHRNQFARLADLDSLTAFFLGLEAEARKDGSQAWAYYNHALGQATKDLLPVFNLRVGLRLARLATQGGDEATAKIVMQQVVRPLQRILPTTLDVVAEEELMSRWQSVAKTAARRPARRPAAAPGTPPLVTAIVSTFKSERFIRGCLEDLEAQTIADRLEIIVVDSNSPQNERAVVEEFQKRYSNIVYIRTHERETVYGAWNRGARAARGKYLTNANTDDRHRADALEVMARVLEKNPDASLVYSDCLITMHENETFETGNPMGCYLWLEFNARDLFNKGCYMGPQPMWRREVHEEHGYFDAAMVSAGDYEFWLRLAQNRKFLHIRETLGLYLKSPTSVEHSNRDAGARETKLALDRYRAAILDGKPPFRPNLPEPTARVEIMTRAAEQPVAALAPAAAPAVARIGQLNEARELLGRKNLAEAWSATLAALARRPCHPEAFLLLAEIALAAGDGKLAKRCAQRARELAPAWSPAKQFLTRLLKGAATLDWLKLPPQWEAAPPRLSICLIVKNEERFLGQCLKSVRGLGAQIVVVDTGSTDRTVEIAREFGAEIYSFAWCDDFAAARNAALEHATGDWVLMLDADEELPAAQHVKLLADMKHPAAIALRLPLVNAGQEQEGRSFVPRLFRNAPEVCFTGRIHEQVFSSLLVQARKWGLKTALGSAELLHHGYTPELVQDRNKIERNLKLLRAALAEQPDDVNLVMNLGLELVRSDDLAGGLEKYRHAYDLMSAQPVADLVPELREVLLTQFTSQLYKLRGYDEIVQVLRSPLAGEGGLTASLNFALGLAHFELKQFSEAADQMCQCLAKRRQPGLTPINTDILTAAPQHCLALSLAKLGRTADAEKAFVAALAETGPVEAARLDYARFLRAQSRPVDALNQLHGLVTANSRNAAAWQFGGEIALGHAEFLGFARDWTAEALRAMPDNPVIAAQRAEALMLNSDAAAAAPLWEKIWSSEHDGRTLAALILCETVSGRPAHAPNPGPDEQATSRALVSWYQKLISVGAKPLLEQINQHLEPLSRALPTAGQMLHAALSEADVAVGA